jgi:hypothetical protein
MEYLVYVPATVGDETRDGEIVRAAIEAEIPHTLDVATTGEIVGSFVAPPRGAFVVREK